MRWLQLNECLLVLPSKGKSFFTLTPKKKVLLRCYVFNTCCVSTLHIHIKKPTCELFVWNNACVFRFELHSLSESAVCVLLPKKVFCSIVVYSSAHSRSSKVIFAVTIISDSKHWNDHHVQKHINYQMNAQQRERIHKSRHRHKHHQRRIGIRKSSWQILAHSTPLSHKNKKTHKRREDQRQRRVTGRITRN